MKKWNPDMDIPLFFLRTRGRSAPEWEPIRSSSHHIHPEPTDSRGKLVPRGTRAQL